MQDDFEMAARQHEAAEDHRKDDDDAGYLQQAKSPWRKAIGAEIAPSRSDYGPRGFNDV
jgi:hypothetical protein